MTPMCFIGKKNVGRARNRFIRVGTEGSDSSYSVVGGLVEILAGLGGNVGSLMDRGGGHDADEDADTFTAWIAGTTGRRS